MIVTKHAKQRMKQRCGLKEKSSDKAYIFTGDKLITVIQIPHNLVKEVDKLRRIKQKCDTGVKFEKNEKGTL